MISNLNGCISERPNVSIEEKRSPERYIFFCVSSSLSCSGQLKLATVLEFFRYWFSDSFGGNP
ncbi:hypothetical protein ABN357_09455, partial [Providencia rettgeri]|uniref:hypothetical protein n=1 Tax=Providencia rettgeri TaxID=587 RepID=UPI0032DBC2D1